MKKSAPIIKAMFAMTAILLAAVSVLAQGTKTKAAAATADKRAASTRSSSAVVAVGKEGRLDFVKDKALVLKSMQRAFEKVKEREIVKDVNVRNIYKVNYLVVNLEGQKKDASMLFLPLVPVSEGSAYHTIGPHVVTCVNVSGCGLYNCITIQPGNMNSSPSPICQCYGQGNTPGTCTFQINKGYLPALLDSLNAELLAVGFEEAGGGTKVEGPNNQTWTVAPGTIKKKN